MMMIGMRFTGPLLSSSLLPPVDRQLLMDSSENVGFVVNGLSAEPHQTVKISTH